MTHQYISKTIFSQARNLDLNLQTAKILRENDLRPLRQA